MEGKASKNRVLFDETEWTGKPEIFKVNAEDTHAVFYPYQDMKTALSNNERASEYYQSLNGKWKFKWAENPRMRPTHFQGIDFDDTDWDDIPVPCSWTVLRNEDGSLKYDHPIYTNTAWAWKGNDDIQAQDTLAPSYVNAVGTYRMQFVISESWQNRRVYLNFDGVEAAFYVWLNGEQVGYGEDTFCRKEFDITPYIREGKNTLAVQVYKWCDGSWLEDQDMFYQAGIFRDVYLTSKNAVAQIRDFELVTDLDENYRNAKLRVYGLLQKSEGGKREQLTLKGKLFDHGDLITEFEKEVSILESGTVSVVLEAEVETPHKWSAEDPFLYDLVLMLSSDNEILETTAVKVGFRKVEIIGQGTNHAQICLNGKPIYIKGINQQEINEYTGRYVTREQTEEELKMMKQSNINALRMGHYPHAPYVYELCDAYGIYVMSEANVECHGDMRGVSGNPAWGAAVLDRVETMFHLYKNHACVIFWSVGNEQGASDINKAAYYRIKELDRSKRVVNYDQDQIHSDIISNGYRLPYELPGYQDKGKPFLMLEYSHCFGNSVGNLKELWNVIEDPAYPSIQGGFIWDWVDQSVSCPLQYVKNEVDGKEYLVTGALMTGRLSDNETADRSLRGYIDMINTGNLELGNVFTFEADIKPDVNTGRVMVILSKGNEVQLRLVSNLSLEFLVNGTTVSYMIPENKIKDSQWHRVSGNYDNGTLKLYYDGLEVASESNAIMIENTDNIVIGSNAQELANAFYGRIDNVHVYKASVAGTKVNEILKRHSTAVVWCDMNGENVGKTGESYFGYGGDWMDYGNNKHYCANGLLLPDRTVQPKLFEVKKVYQNGEITLGKNAGTILVKNKNIFLNMDRYELYWEVKENHKILQSGTLPLDIEPGEEKEILLPWQGWEEKAGCEYWLNVYVQLKEDELWAQQGHIVMEEQLLLRNAGEASVINEQELDHLTCESNESEILIQGENFQVVISKTSGEITSFRSNGADLISQGPIPNYFRAPVDKDRGAFDLADQIWRWQDAGVNRNVQNIQLTVNKAKTLVTVAIAGTLPIEQSWFGMTYSIYGDGTIRVDNTLCPEGIGNDIIPVIGNIMRIPKVYDHLTWYGKGPYETCSDRKTSAAVDVYHSTVEEQFFPYMRPQETGNHDEIRWMTLTNTEGKGIMISGLGHWSGSALWYTPSEMAEKTHPYQLVKEEDIVLRVDHKQMGVGGATSWGHWPMEEYLLRADRKYSYTYYLTPIFELNVEAIMRKSRTSYETDKENPVTYMTMLELPMTQDKGEMTKLSRKWSIIRRQDDGWEVSDAYKDQLVLKAQGGTITGDGDNTSRNIVLTRTPSGPGTACYEVIVKMSGKPTEDDEAAGMIVYSSDDRYVRLQRKVIKGISKVNFMSKDKGIIIALIDVEDTIRSEVIWFKIVRNTIPIDTFTAFYSGDGERWSELGTVNNTGIQSEYVGVFADGANTGNEFAYESFSINGIHLPFCIF